MITEILLITVLILNILDIYTTHRALSGSNAKEANPIVKFFIDKLGLVFGLLAIKIPFIILIVLFYNIIPLLLFQYLNNLITFVV